MCCGLSILLVAMIIFIEFSQTTPPPYSSLLWAHVMTVESRESILEACKEGESGRTALTPGFYTKFEGETCI